MKIALNKNLHFKEARREYEAFTQFTKTNLSCMDILKNLLKKKKR